MGRDRTAGHASATAGSDDENPVAQGASRR